MLAFSALKNNDKVGVIFFSDVIEKFIPPKKGRSHVWRVIRETLTFKPTRSGTELTLLHEQFFDMAARDGHERGWTGTMEKLARYLKSHPN